MINLFRKFRVNKKGFTIAELMISVTILTILMTIASSIYSNFFGSIRNLKAANTVYEEARFVMERIVKEVRNGTIDYEEYFNQNLLKQNLSNYESIRNETYARDYCQYSRQFYNLGPDDELGTIDDESTGTRVENDLITGAQVPPAIGDLSGNPEPIQNDLFLININGDKRSYIKRIEKEDGTNTIGKIGLLRLTGEDFGIDHINSFDEDLSGFGNDDTFECEKDPGEGDGRIDTWLCEDGFACEKIDLTGDSCSGKTHNIVYDPNDPEDNSYIDITPSSLDIVDLKFIVAPMDDPRKAYNNIDVQIQPHVTIRLVARANPKLANEFKSGRLPDIILESTVSARAYNEIITECNLRQCTQFSTPEPCLLTQGVAGPQDPVDPPATQTCTDYFVWSGCTTETYEDYAELEWGSAYDAYYASLSEPRPGNGEIYQHGSEFASCPDDTGDNCEELLCSDGFDNDADGFSDENDADCQEFLCNNGIYDGIEEAAACIDVGGLCQEYHEYEETTEENCYDNYDNDCDGDADEFDADCVAKLCSNGLQDPMVGEAFLRADYTPRNYLVGAEPGDYVSDFDETCIDVGGYCPDVDVSGNPETYYCDTTYDPITEEAEYNACLINVCSDGLDNDCDGYADELDGSDTSGNYTDDDCTAIICNDNQQNCDLVPPGYTYTDYLVDYVDTDSPACSDPAFGLNDEAAVDVGGICDGWRDVVESNYVDHTLISSEDNPHSYSPPTQAAHTCNDGLDNDNDGLIDDLDDDCCSDGDGDLFILSDGVTCNPPPLTEVDCDDTDPNTYPGATEVCDGTKDNDCDGDDDEDDVDCCVDTDGDFYGVADAYLSCPGGFPNPPEADCNDLDPDIHPNAAEDTQVLCFNEVDSSTPVNDNCKTLEIDDPGNPGNPITVERANHIDWYHDVLSGGIAEAYEYSYFEPNCCNFGAVEVCDDNTYSTYGSDENCNGLEGYDDNYCIGADGLSFYDTFTSSNYISSTDAGVNHDTTSGVITLDNGTYVGVQVISSYISPLDASACPGDYQITILPSADTPSGTSIKYQISNDAGSTWCSESTCDGLDWIEAADAHTITFGSPTNYEISWKASLEGDGASNVPSINHLTLTLNCL